MSSLLALRGALSALFLLFFWASSLQAAVLPPSPHYRVWVNGQAVPVTRITVNPSNRYQDVAAPGAMAHLRFDGPLRVEVEVLDRAIHHAQVRPFSRGVRVQTGGSNRAAFTLDQPGSFYVQINESYSLPLLLFADRPDTDVPQGPNVRYFGPGVHEAGAIDVESGQTIYLAEGAWVKGHIRANAARDITIRGRGVLYGGHFRRGDIPRGARLITLNGCQNIHIEGITLLDSPTWNIRPQSCRDLTIENVKIIGWRRNSDGIDPVNGENIRIRDCFILTQDDGITIKGAGGALKNIVVERCTMWQNFMRAFVLGGELRGVSEFQDIVFRDSDVIFNGYNPAHERDAPLSVWNVDAAHARNVLFEDIRVEDCTRLVRIGIVQNKHSRDQERGRVSNVTFRNITSRRADALIEITGHGPQNRVEGVLFENLQMGGRRIARPEEVRLKTNEWVGPIVWR